VFFERPRRFSDDDKTILATFASQAAVALENQRLMREKDVLARTDGLTGVFNRSYLELSLDQAMHSVHRNGGLVSLLFIDVDDLKATNDQRGHQAGDRACCASSPSCWPHSCRETDTVARYGGDEFVVLMPGTDALGARQVLAKIDRAIERRNAAAPRRHSAARQHGPADLGLVRPRRAPAGRRPQHVRDEAPAGGHDLTVVAARPARYPVRT
jgi:diguanylate cyclase (GGDEF)-like protein